MHRPSFFLNRNFFLVWIASAVESLALNLTMLVEAWYVVDTLNMKAEFGWVVISAAIPRIGFMVLGGVVADRSQKTKILGITFYLRAMVLFAGALLFWSGIMNLWLIGAMATAFGILDAFFWPARDSLLPSIILKDQLPQGNSIMQATGQLGFILGPLAGGMMLSRISPSTILFIAAAGMALSAVLVSLVVEAPTEKAIRKSIILEIKQGIQYVITNPVLRSLMFIYLVANLLFIGPLVIGIPIIASQHLTYGVKGLSYLQSALASGMLAGFLSMTKFPPSRKRMLWISYVLIAEGILLGALGNVYVLWLAVGIQFFLGFCIACNNIPMISLIQHYSERENLGRVMSTSSMVSMGLYPLSYAMVAGLLSIGISVETILFAFGCMMSVIILLIAINTEVIQTTQ